MLNIRYLFLYFPFLLSVQYSDDPLFSYAIAWLGSIFIMYMTITGKIIPVSDDLPLLKQIFRPFFLMHIILFTYMSLSSVFYFLDSNGYFYFEYMGTYVKQVEDLAKIAECQRIYNLAHAAFATGILIFSNREKRSKWQISFDYKNPVYFMRIMMLFFFLSLVTAFIPGLGQLRLNFVGISYVSAFWLLYFSYKHRPIQYLFIILGGVIIGINFYQAVFSGWKELTLIPLIVLGAIFFPDYPKTTTVFGLLGLSAWLWIMPTFNIALRESNEDWLTTEVDEEAATKEYKNLSSDENIVTNTNWEFLVDRFSEIGTFTIYIESVPAQRSFYGFEILDQAIQMLTPRIFWPEKPNVEKLVMQRVYDNGVASENSLISAKPQYIVDGYLSNGYWGVFWASITLGLVLTFICNLAEFLFGSYEMGAGLVFTGIYLPFWKGSCFEFLINALFWGTLTIYTTFLILRNFGLIRKRNEA